MNPNPRYYCSAALLLFALSTYAQKGDVYTYQNPAPGGTEKKYMGGEIAQLMSFHGIDWLERSSRPEEENTALAISNLPVSDNSVVADLGAGSGYYTFRIAEKVPKGKVYAVEIQ